MITCYIINSFIISNQGIFKQKRINLIKIFFESIIEISETEVGEPDNKILEKRIHQPDCQSCTREKGHVFQQYVPRGGSLFGT